MSDRRRAREPVHVGEPPQDRGRRTRRVILERAATLFARRPPAEVSVSEIAAAAQVYPNQITYYFGSKDALFVHAAFLLLLHDAQRIEPAGRRMRTPARFREVVARAALVLPSVPVAVHALAVSRGRAELAAAVEPSLTVLFRQSEHYLQDMLDTRGWAIDRSAAEEVRTFWGAVFGAALVAATGFPAATADIDLPGVLTVRAAGAAQVGGH